MTFIAIICGLKSEAKVVEAVAKGRNIRIGVSGANAAKAEEIARDFLNDGAAAVVSVGVSGGLDPALAPGALVIGDAVTFGEGERIDADAFLIHAAKKAPAGAHAVIGPLYGADEIIDSAEAKADLFVKTQALAVDMESHGCARAAKAADTPFIAIRAIADPWDRALPPAALGAIAPDGSTLVLKTLGAAFRDPGQFPALMKLGADSGAATKALRRDLGPILGRLFLALGGK